MLGIECNEKLQNFNNFNDNFQYWHKLVFSIKEKSSQYWYNDNQPILS